MNRNILRFWMGAVFCAAMPLCAQQKPETTNKAEIKRSKIELFNVDEQHKGVKFISNGKERKQITETGKIERIGDKWRREALTIEGVTEDNKFVLVGRIKSEHDYDPSQERDSAAPGEYWDEEVQILNADGEIAFQKNFRIYPGEDLLTTSYWKSEFSKEGTHFYVYYKDEKGGSNIEIYNVNGKELAQGHAPGDIQDLNITPEGRFIVGYFYSNDEKSNQIVKSIFLLDSKTNRQKNLLASGVIAGKEWGASFIVFNPNPKNPKEKVWVSVGFRKKSPAEKSIRWEGYLGFDDAPLNLADLLSLGKEK